MTQDTTTDLELSRASGFPFKIVIDLDFGSDFVFWVWVEVRLSPI